MRTTVALLSLALAAPMLGAPATFLADFGAGEGTVPQGWTFQKLRGACSAAWDAKEPMPQGRSIRLGIPEDATARATWRCTQKIELKGNTAYELTFRYMLADVTRAGKGAYIIGYENGVEAATHWHMSPFLHGSQDWATHRIAFVTRPDTTWLKLQCKLWEATGYAWFDDVRIAPIDPENVEQEPAPELQLPADDRTPLQLIWYPAHRRIDRTVCLLEGVRNPVALFFRGDRSKVKNAALIVETPTSLTVAGPMVAGRSPIPKPVVLRPQPSRSDGTSRLQWRIPIDSTTLSRKLNPDSVSWDRYYHVYVTPGTAAPSSFTWRWCIENAGEPGPWHALPGRIVPRLAPGALAPLPAFKLFAQHSSALRLPSREERDDVLDYLFYAGVTGGLALSHYQPELKRIDAELNAAGYFTWAWAWHGYGGPANDGQRLVFAEKARRKRPGVCPQVQADRDEPFWSWLVERYCRPLALDMPWIIINYEPPVFSVCFCPQCRNAFATFAGMAHEAVGKLTPEQLQKLPGDQWGKFRARQNAEVVQTHVAAIRQTDAAIRIGICGPGWVDDIANRGMDIRLFEPDVSLHAPMLYHEPLVYERLVRSTCENTAADVMPFLLASDIAVPRVFPTPADVRINLLATALSGGQGAVLWVGIESLDGEYMNALRRGMEEIRTLEPFMLGGSRRNELCGLPDAGRVRTVKVGAKLLKVPTRNSVSPIRSWGWESERGELLAFINYDEEAPRVMRLGASDADEPRVLFGPVPQREGESLRLTLQPGEFAALVR